MAMSRLVDPVGLPAGAKKIRVVCSDKGQHAESSFGYVIVWQEADGWRSKPFLQHEEYVDTEPVESDVTGLPDRLHRKYRFPCRRCRRNVPLRQETLEKICAVFAEADKRKIDISDLSE